MFKNPLRKYQSGGTTPTEEQEELAAFVEWLPQRIEEFANMQPAQVVEALNGMSKTEEGKRQVRGWMEQFKEEMQGAKPTQFEKGGKIHQFLCKHAKGGHIAGCGCKEDGGVVEAQRGAKFISADKQVIIKNPGTPQADTIGRYSYPTRNGEFRFKPNGERTATEWLNGDVFGTKYANDVWMKNHPFRAIFRQSAPEGYFDNLVQRVENRTESKQEGGELTRRDAIRAAADNLYKGNRAAARDAYMNAKYGLEKAGLRGRALRQAARRMIAGIPQQESVYEAPIQPDEMNFTNTEVLPPISTPISTPSTSLDMKLSNRLAGVPNQTTQQDLNNMSFNDAFATARGDGKTKFVWNGKAYTTELAQPQQEGPAMWGNEGFMWNDTRYAVPYGEARLRNTFLRKLGGKINK